MELMIFYYGEYREYRRTTQEYDYGDKPTIRRETINLH
jgi:hypothetical protein